MRIDLDFIPQDLLPDKIKELLKGEFEYPYVDEEKFPKNFLKTKRAGQGASPPEEVRQQRRNNFVLLEKELINFACSQKKQGNETLAEEVFKFLVEIGSKFAKPKEELVKFYQKTNNKRCLKWILKRINDQIKFEHLEEENQRLMIIKEELIQKQKQKKRRKK
jgi:hypothetical protein